jgi:hypothetical protein
VRWCGYGIDAPESSAIEACGPTRRLDGAAFGGRLIQQPTSPAVPSRLTGTPASRQPPGHARWPGGDAPSARAASLASSAALPHPSDDSLTRPSPGAATRTRVPTLVPTHAGGVPPASPARQHRSSSVPFGGVERALGKVRFARLIHSGARVLGGPAVRAACGGNPSLPWQPRRVVRAASAVLIMGCCRAVRSSVSRARWRVAGSVGGEASTRRPAPARPAPTMGWDRWTRA